MNFPDSYFEDEVKAGFFVSAKMKSYWAMQLEVLNEIDRICRKHHIQYFAEWGTLLGTVRHRGYIPWDDDMDIAMKRMDYEKFRKVLPGELPKEYAVLDYEEDKDYWDVMTRVLNAEFVDCSPEFLDKYHNCPFAGGVDIFPLDYASRNPKEEQMQKELVELVKTAADTNGAGLMNSEELEEWLAYIEKVSGQKIDRQGNIKNQLYKIVCALYALFGEEEADNIAAMPQRMENGGHLYPKECYADSILMPFENIMIPMPVGYDCILKLKYGDYMKSVRKGGSHDYPLYDKQERYLNEKGVSFPQYKYTENKEKKKPIFSITLQEKLQLLIKIHEQLEVLMQYGEKGTVLQLLQEMQNVAVGIGESIEKKVGEGTQTVACLEQYCEMAYQVYEMICEQGMPDPGEVRTILDETVQMIMQEAEQMKIRREVVFMPYHASHWSVLESLWQEASADEDCDVKVVPIPYYYKRQMGAALSEMQYDGDQFPDYVQITPCYEYFVENNHPDIIYIQNPYDQWNYSVTVNEKYYSSELWKNTEQLIYIPWFKIDEMDPEDERGLKSREYFVPFPGVVNADQVIVQSEAMKQSYVEYLCQWAGEETRSIWEEKIQGTGAELYEVKKEVQRPTEWQDKKLILYYISGNGLLEHKEKMISKIEYALKVFEEQKEHIHVLWLQDESLRERLLHRVPGILKKYENLLKKYDGKDWITIEGPLEEEKAVEMADAFYGDAGRTAQLVKQSEKPVMLQNVEIQE